MKTTESATIILRGKRQQQESLAPLNTWHIGGKAKQTYRPADLEDLQTFLKTLPANEKIIWLGLGSNVLISDEGIDGTVILPHPGLGKIEGSNMHVYAQAGVPCAKLAKFCAKQGLAGGGFFSGIPGTVGGALAMNAGAFGGETWPLVQSVETINRKGEVFTRDAREFQVSYRHVDLPVKEEWFVGAHFLFTKTDEVDAQQNKIKELLRERKQKQPIGELNCGSVFRNPPNGYAAQLIESCQLKGFRIGDAMVSEKHANFIINVKNACAADVKALILQIQQQVFAKTGVQLVPEVHFLD